MGQRYWGGGELGSSALAFAVQLAGFCWYAALGSVIGRFVPVLVAGPAAAVAAMGLFFRLADGDGFLLMHFGASTVSRIGVELNPTYLGLQLLVFAGTATLFMMPRVWPAREPLRRSPHLLGVAAIAVSVVVLVSVRGWGPEQRQMLADPYPPDRCFGENPTVCYYPQHLRVVEFSMEAISDYVDRLRKAGYHDLIPDTIHETSRSYLPTDPAVQMLALTGSELEGRRPDPTLMFQSLLLPGHCGLPVDGSPEEQRFYDLYHQLVEAVAWIYESLRVEYGEEAYDKFGTLPWDDDTRRTPAEISEIAAKLRSCEF